MVVSTRSVTSEGRSCAVSRASTRTRSACAIRIADVRTTTWKGRRRRSPPAAAEHDAPRASMAGVSGTGARTSTRYMDAGFSHTISIASIGSSWRKWRASQSTAAVDRSARRQCVGEVAVDRVRRQVDAARRARRGTNRCQRAVLAVAHPDLGDAHACRLCGCVNQCRARRVGLRRQLNPLRAPPRRGRGTSALAAGGVGRTSALQRALQAVGNASAGMRPIHP